MVLDLKLFKLAIKFLVRRKRNIIFAIILLVAFTSLIIINNIEYIPPRAQIEVYNQTRFGDVVILGDVFNESFINALKRLNNIKDAVGVLSYSTIVSSGNDTYNVIVYGILKDPPVDTIPGIDWDSFTGTKIIIDPGLALFLNLHIGDKFHLFGEEFEIFSIKRVLWAPDLRYNNVGSIIMRYEMLRTLLNLTNVFNEIRVKFIDIKMYAKTLYDILNLSKRYGYNITIQPRIFTMEILLESFSPLIKSLFITAFLIVIITIVFHIVLDIKTTTKELCMLELIGISIDELVLIYLIQSTILLLISIFLAIPTGLLISQYLANKVLEMLSIELDVWKFLTIPWGILIVIAAVALILSFVVSKILLERIKLYNIVKFGDEVPEIKKEKASVGNISTKWKIGLRNITTRKFRSIILVMLLAIAIIPAEFSSVLITSTVNTYISTCTDEFLWDFRIIIFDVRQYEQVKTYIYSMQEIRIINEIIFAFIPILSVSSSKKAVIPPYNTICIMGLNGHESLIRLKFIEGDFQTSGIVISQKIALILRVHVGDTITIKFTHPYGFNSSISFSVVGIIKTVYFGGWVILLHNSYIKKFLSRPVNNTLLVKVKSNSEEQALRKITDFMIRNKINGHIELKERLEKRVKEIQKSLEIWINPAMITVQSLLLLAFILAISREIQMRSREIAILHALGMTFTEIIKIIFVEYLIITLITIPISIILLYFQTTLIAHVVNTSLMPLWIDLKITFENIFHLIISVAIVLSIILMITVVFLHGINLKEKLSFLE